ncbi:MAG: tetratricopeptide repeat protein [Candidatus Loosdrechtia sp.]|uniref:tetratricopeptide repeat protein n=1 Tax=Candidatus Loosdrechtia sp. TaxID=3101272 RepID=UPI003A5EE250|nr:MAG: tetratricopeptide repeat protein [Candidatus Jettenia sp. AMX2]
MKSKILLSITLVICVTGCSSWSPFSKKRSSAKAEDSALKSRKGVKHSPIHETDTIFVSGGDIDTSYQVLDTVSLSEFGFSGHDVLAYKIREKARELGAQAVIKVTYDTGASKSWRGYGELGGTDYGIRHTSWCKGTAIIFTEPHNHLGFLVCNLTKDHMEWFNLRKAQTGVLVTHVLPGSTAAHTGIKAEDLITQWNGEKVENKNHLMQLIQASANKKENRLTVLRTGETHLLTLFTPEKPATRLVASPQTQSPVKERKPAPAREKTTPAKTELYNADLYNEIGDLYLRKGMYDEAIREYQKAIEADPDCALAYFNLSIVYGKKGMSEEADREFEKYKKLRAKRR